MAHLQYLADRGHPVAIAALQRPEHPPELDYLYDWFLELHGHSGVTMAGLAPLSWGTLADWSRETGHRLTSVERDALFLLDAVMLNPEDGNG